MQWHVMALYFPVIEALFDPEKGKELPCLVIATLFLNSLPHSSLVSFVFPVLPCTLQVVLLFCFTKYILLTSITCPVEMKG